MLLSLAFISSCLLSLSSASCAPTVSTSNGKIQGGKCKSTNVNYFFSIPYAKPPVGDLRYAAPQPYTKHFNGSLDATKTPSSCIQFDSTFGETNTQSEDCLFLNVWAPTPARKGSKLPVKVWLYGGGNEAGGIDNPTYDGCFSTTDSILVSINYRVGPLGFLALKGLGLSGNLGIRDQILGLQWVQENIEAFGGDPKKVLLFGESAGAMDTYAIATLEEAPKLMRAAAMESGGGRDYATVEQAQAVHKTFAAKLNCSDTDLSCFRSASTSSIQAAVSAMPQAGVPEAYTWRNAQGARTDWGPLVDESLIPVSPGAVGVRVPSIFGSNANEGSLFVLAAYAEKSFSIGQTAYDSFLVDNFGSFAPEINETFSLSKFNGSAFAAMAQVMTDASYKCSAYRGLVRGARNGVPVWSYEFKHPPSCAWYQAIPQEYLKYLGATHTSEIPFVFNTTRNMPLPDGNCTFTAKEQALAVSMSRAWTNMAESGSPGDEDFWPQFTTNTSSGVNIADAIEPGTVDYTHCKLIWDAVDTAMGKNQSSHSSR